MIRTCLLFSAAIACLAQASGQAASPASRAPEDQWVKAEPLRLEAVRLSGGPLKAAQAADAKFLLTVEPDRALAALRTAAGLEAKARPLAGWDKEGGRSLTGHMAGHLLSALSLMYAATGDARFKERADYMVGELAAIQQKYPDGYLGAQQDSKGTAGREIYKQISAGDVRSRGEEDLNGLWSPWYVEHKIFAGLRDAYRHTRNKTALEVEQKLAAWAETTLAPLSDEQIQKMLKAEFGGMNEVLVDLYADSGDDRWLKLSQKFEDRSITEPLAQGKDILGGQHANHNIPKLVGAAARFACTGQAEDRRGAEFFWTSVVNHHSFATGGNSGGADGEHFPAGDKLAAMIARAPSAQTNESCNVYNMLKLTRRLFSFDPDPRYADFLERALLNHALAQINPASGLMSYHVPVGQDVQHNYQGSDSTGINTGFTCCVGTGMENPALYGEGIYYAAGDKLWVNLYAPSTAQWKEKSVELAMESDMPEGEIAKLTLTVKEPTEFTLALRRPAWTTAAFKATINGQTLPASMTEQAAAARPESLPPSTYVEIRRTWKTGDTIELVIPKSLRLEPTPDDPSVAAILWGPLVLGEDMGPAVRRAPAASGGRAAPVVDKNPVLVVSSRTVSDWLKPIDGRPGEFRTDGVGRIAASPATPVELKFVPLYRLHDRTYSVYMNVLSPDAWSHRTGETQ